MHPRKIVAQLIASLALATSPAWAQSERAPSGAEEAQTQLILLGTAGGPVMRKTHAQPASLLVVHGKSYLIDSGDGVARQLVLADHQPSEVGEVFLTHLHFDHTAGLGALLAFNWISPRHAPVAIYGPPGTKALVEGAVNAYAAPEAIFAPLLPGHVSMHDAAHGHDLDVTSPQVVYTDENLRVLAVENSHYATQADRRYRFGPLRSYSYRFETPGKVVVFTGDTGPSEAVADLAKGADILVSEIIDVPAVVAELRSRKATSEAEIQAAVAHMEQEHLSPAAVGELAKRAGVKMVVLSHYGFARGQEADGAALAEQVRQVFHGPVVAGRDLQRF